MRNLLFAALLLGCFLCHVSGQNGVFEFYDDNGNCWRCTPGNSCERCHSVVIPELPRINPRVSPIEWPSQCPLKPDCEELRATDGALSVKFPSVDSRNYFVCRPDPADSGKWIANERECPCETIFDYSNQRCDWPWVAKLHCENFNYPIKIDECPGGTEPSVIPIDPTPDPITTQQPCMCIPWWPCWCNPCWNMPCGSCSGCVVG